MKHSTSNENKERHDQRNAPRADQTRVRAQKVGSAIFGALMTQQSVLLLSPTLIGCLVLLGQRVISGNLVVADSSMALSFALGTLISRGIPATDARSALSALQDTGLITIADDRLRIPSIDAVLNQQARLLSNRQDGWVKRDSAASLVSVVTVGHVSLSAPAAVAASVAPTALPSAMVPEHRQSSLLPFDDALGVALATVLKPTRKTLASVSNGALRRFGATDQIVPVDSDPTAVRFDCEGGRTAEITQSLIDTLQAVYTTIDVAVQLRHSAAWCAANKTRQKTFIGLRRFMNAWLSRASQDKGMRAEVARASSQGNGFGRGGAYEPDTRPPAPVVMEADDLADFDSLAIPTAAPAPPVQAPAKSLRGAPPQRRVSDSIRDQYVG